MSCAEKPAPVATSSHGITKRIASILLVFLLPLFAVFFVVACRSQPEPEPIPEPNLCPRVRVEWIGVPRNDGATNLEVGRNPANRGGGDRIFPDRNYVSGDLHDRVLVRATLEYAPTPETPLLVQFKLFDEDHYSNDKDFDTNGSNGDDNVQASPLEGPDISAKLMKADFSAEISHVSLYAPQGNTAELGLQITHLQPGNNWKVAVRCQAARGPKDNPIIPPEPTNWRQYKQTPLLTVWRRLYVEIDRMADPVLNTGPGQSKFDGGAAARTGAKTVQLTLGGGNTIVTSQVDQFRGGKIELLDAANRRIKFFDVTKNSTGGNPTITTVQDVPAETAKFKDLIDDDINNTSAFKVDTSAKMTPDTSLWAGRLEPALVVPVFNQPEVSAKNSNAVTFDVHIGDDPTDYTEEEDIKKVIRANKGSKSEPGFWVVYQLGAFQPRMDEEYDPNTGKITSGVASERLGTRAANDTEAGTIVYAETIRECENRPTGRCTISISDRKKITSIHEIGHQFGMFDGPDAGSLMDSDYINFANTPALVDALIWNGAGLRQIMLTEQPGHNPHGS